MGKNEKKGSEMKTVEMFDWTIENDKIYYKWDSNFSNASRINFSGQKVNVDKDGVKFDTFLTQLLLMSLYSAE